MITVVIADDHPMVRQGLRAVLESVDDIHIIGEADNGLDAVTVAEQLQPAVIVMDLHMPALHGIDATRQLATTCPDTAVLVLTMFEDDDTVFTALGAGAIGYLLKGADSDEIIAAIRAAADGQAIFGPALARRLRAWFTTGTIAPAAPPFPELTPREHDILDQLAGGLTNAEIGQHLHLSPKTIANNISIILNKLHVTQRSQAIVRARQAGLGQPPDRSPSPTRDA
ncbi:MAG: response regulator transcription factor [Acidimicrobiales bacterium]